MFDIGWLELLVIGIVALIVVGPEDLPTMFRNAGRFMGRMRGMAREFQRSMEDAADQTGLKEATSEFNRMGDLGIKSPGKSARAYANGLLKDDDGKKAKPRPPAAADTAADTAEAQAEGEAAADRAEAEADLAEAAEAEDVQMPDAGKDAPSGAAPAESETER